MKLYVWLTPYRADRPRNPWSGGITAPEPYVFLTDVRTVQRVNWGPTMLAPHTVRVAAFVPDEYRRFLKTGDARLIDGWWCWLTANLKKGGEYAKETAHNEAVLREFIANGAKELNSEVRAE